MSKIEVSTHIGKILMKLKQIYKYLQTSDKYLSLRTLNVIFIIKLKEIFSFK